MKINVLFFAQHRRAAGIAQTEIEVTDSSSVQMVSEQIAKQYQLDLKGSMVAINDRYATPQEILHHGDTLAFIPPVSGGAPSNDDLFLVTDQALSIAELHAHLVEAQWGGQAMFTGSTRSPNKGESIVHLEYEAYPAFCYAEMQRIAAQARDHFELGRVVMAHRTGTVLAGEVSIFIGAASTHRKACLAAVPWMLDEAKKRLPVWKLELTESGERWVEGSTSTVTLT